MPVSSLARGDRDQSGRKGRHAHRDVKREEPKGQPSRRRERQAIGHSAIPWRVSFSIRLSMGYQYDMPDALFSASILSPGERRRREAQIRQNPGASWKPKCEPRSGRWNGCTQYTSPTA